MKHDLRSNFHHRVALRTRGRSRRPETGDTLVEVLLAVMVMGISSVAILLAFGTSIFGSSEYRGIAAADTVLRTAAEEATTYLQQNAAEFSNCGAVAQLDSNLAANIPNLPTGYSVQSVTATYWSSSQARYLTQTDPLQCPPGAATDPSELVTITIGYGSNSFSISTVVSDPTAPLSGTPGSAAQLVFLGQPGNGTAGNDLSTPPEVGIEDDGTPPQIVTTDLSSVQLTLNSPSGVTGASLSGLCTGAEIAGVITFSNCSVNEAGSGFTITATDTELPTGSQTAQSQPFNILPSTPAQIAFKTTPTSGIGGSSLTSEPQVQVNDLFGDAVTNDSSSLSLSIEPGTGTAGAQLTTGCANPTESSGVFSFPSNCAVTTAGTGYVLVATDGSMTAATPTSFNVVAGTASSLIFSTQPSASNTTGVNLSTQPVVSVADAGGNAISGSTTAALSLVSAASSPSQGMTGNGSLTCTGGTNIAANSSGHAIYSGCKVTLTNPAVGGTFELKATGTAYGSVYSQSFTVAATSNLHLYFSTSPLQATSGVVFSSQPVVEVLDANNDLVTSSNASILLEDGGSHVGTVTCPGGSTTVAAVNGIATFSHCEITLANPVLNNEGSFTLEAYSSSSLLGTTIITVAGPATQLAFVNWPGSSTSATTFGSQPVVQVEDAAGDLVTNSTAIVTLNINSGSGSLGCPTFGGASVAAAGGVATFSGCEITLAPSNPGGPFKLGASAVVSLSTINATVPTPSFTVAGTASRLVFTTQPSNGTGGVNLATQPQVSIEDLNGDVVTADSSTVTLSLNSPGNTSAAISDTCAGSESLGVVTFSGCSVNLAGSGYTFTASDAALTTTTSSPFNITTGAAAQLAFTTSPQGGIAGQVFGVQPVVAVEDAGGNLITTGPAKSIALAISGGAPLSCTSNPVTTSGGIATFAGCSTTSAGVNMSLSATASSFPVALSSSFNVSPGSASILAITSSPVSGQASQQANLGPITLQEEDAYGNPVTVLSNSGLSVTLTSSSSAGVFSNIGGTPTGPNITIPYGSSLTSFYYGDTAAGTPTVTASASGFTPASEVQTIIPGPAAQLAPITSAPVSGPASATANLGPITVQELDQFGNPAPAPTGGQVIALSAAPNNGTFSTSIGGSGTSVTMPAGSSSVAFYFGDEAIGSQTITASAFGTQATQAETIGSGIPSATQSTVVASATSVTASNSTGTTITVTDLDAYGNPVVGDTVTLTAGGGSSTITTSPGTTNSSGQAIFTVKDTTAQTVTYTAKDTSQGVMLNQTAAVSFVAGAATAANSTVGASPATVNANGTSSSTITVTAKDANSNVVSGDTVTLTAGGGSSLMTTVSGTTNASGQATFTVFDNTTEAVTYTATVAGVQVTQTATVTFASDPLSLTNSSAVASPTSGVTANGTASSLITVTIKDGSTPAEPIANQSITLTQGTGSSTITTSPGTTNASGQVTFTVTDIHAQTVNYTATDTTAGNVVVGTPTVTFVAGAATAANSTVLANPTTGITANGTATSTITVTALDANSNPVAAQAVTLTASPTTGSTITTSPTTTNSSGVATFTVKDTVAGTVTYTAKDTTLGFTIGQTATVGYVAGAVSATNSTVVASTSPVNANGTSNSTVTVTAKDANSNVVSGDTVTLHAGSGSSLITTVSGTTNASGQATFTVFDNTAQAVTYTATVAGVQVTQTATVTFASDPLSLTNSSAVASPTSGVTANGSASSLITVTIKDGSTPAEPIANQTVTLTQGTGSSLITTVSGTTNASGQATFTVTDTHAQTVNYTATDNTAGNVVVGTPTVSFVAGAATAANSTVGASPATVNANGTSSSTITVTAKDANSNVVSGDTVTLTAGGGSSLMTTVSGTTNASGQATFTVFDNTTEAVTYTATVAGVQVTQTATVTFASDPLSLTNSSAVASPTSGVTANGTASSLITVTIKDGSTPAEPIANQSITLTQGTGSSTITTSPGTTNASGQVTFTVTDIHAQTVNYTATDTTAGNVVVGTPTVTFVAGAATAANSTVLANPTTGITANGTATSTITVTALDANSNPVAAQAVTLTASPTTGSTITTSPTTTNSSGVATFTVKDTVAGTVTYTAKDTTLGFTIGQTATVGYVAGAVSASVSTVLASPTSGVRTGFANGDGATINVTVEDANGNVIAGQSVTLTAGSGSSIITTSPTTTNSLGVAAFKVQDGTAQAVTYTATDTTGTAVVLSTKPTVNF